MNSPVPILLILFVILGLAYAPLKDVKNNPSQNNTGSSAINQNANQEVSRDVKDIEREVKKLAESVEENIENRNRSPFYEKVYMSDLIGQSSPDPNNQYFYLYTNLKPEESVNITGWFFKSSITGNYAILGKAALLPFPFTRTESDVVLRQGDRVIITTGFSPIGISFRTNKCTGFFEENRTFYPGLSLECPRPEDENLPKFSSIYDRQDECLDIIESLPRCRTVGSSFIRDLPDTVSSSCKTYMREQINYNTCIARHYSDTNFPGNEYRLFLNTFSHLWRKEREKITLYDRSGLIVDSIEY